MKRPFVNNDKKKDEIVLSDIYQQSSVNFLPNFTGRKRKTIINTFSIFVISTIFFLNMFYVFDKTNNSAVLAVGNFTEVVYKCFPMDMKAVYQRSNLIAFEKKNISLQNIRFDNDKDNQILSSFVNQNTSTIGWHQKEKLRDVVHFWLKSSPTLEKLYKQYHVNYSLQLMIIYNLLLVIPLISSWIFYRITKKIVSFIVNLVVGKKILSYYDFENGRNDGLDILFINKDIEREFKNKLSDLSINDKQKFIELTTNLLSQINNDSNSLLLNDNKIYVDDFYRDNGEICFYYSAMNDIIDFDKILKKLNTEEENNKQIVFNSKIDLIRQNNDELVKLSNKILSIEDNPLLTEKIVNNKDEIVNSSLIEELYKNKRIANC